MAESRSAWGIEIGQAGLKAMRLRVGEDGQTVRATAFDYVPHPKILSQPDAIPEELIQQAVATFLERNNIGSDLIGISVPGHSSLAKFIKLPPVEPGKVAEIVKYEARQQIPFDLEEVVWDYQPIGGGVEESGFMLEAEVGLFAMKREQIYEAMRPLSNRGEEVDLVQIAPLALYNYLSWDVLSFRKTDETPEPPDGEDYYIVLDMGADNTTLLVSNGRSLWIRNVPIGGNHFTRALTREMKLTFAKAEHLKCNATKSPDPKAVFQAMRPVFNDYVTEIQRSIGYFGSVNRAAKIKKVIGVGNGFKLAGLQKFLQQNLQYEVERLEHFDGVTGDSVLSDPLFMENAMTFAVPYGLALQTLQQTRIKTTLLPPEIISERKIRSKKPWAVAAAAGLLLAMGISTMASANTARTVGPDRFSNAYARVEKLTSLVSGNKSSYDAAVGEHDANLKEIDLIAAPLKRRELWLEVFKAVNECLPRDVGNDQDEEDVTKQKKIRILDMTSLKTGDVGEWYTTVIENAEDKEEIFTSAEHRKSGPTGAGYIFTLHGHHFYNNEGLPYEETGPAFVENTLINNLREWTLDRDGVQIPVGQMGITHPVVVLFNTEPEHEFDPDADANSMMMTGGAGRMRGMAGMAGMAGMSGMAGMMGGRGGMGAEDMSNMASQLGMNIGGAGRGRGGRGAAGMGAMMGGRGGAGLGAMLGGRGGAGLGAMLGGRGGLDEQRNAQVLDSVDDEENRVRYIERTDFTLQFAWVPVMKNERVETRPAPSESAGEAGSDDGAGFGF